MKRAGFLAGLAIGIWVGWAALFVASFMAGKGEAAIGAVDRG